MVLIRMLVSAPVPPCTYPFLELNFPLLTEMPMVLRTRIPNTMIKNYSWINPKIWTFDMNLPSVLLLGESNVKKNGSYYSLPTLTGGKILTNKTGIDWSVLSYPLAQ